jgi:hypothetical protein
VHDRCREKARPAQQTVAFRRPSWFPLPVVCAMQQGSSGAYTNVVIRAKAVPPHWAAAGPGPWRFSVGVVHMETRARRLVSGCSAFPLADGQKSAPSFAWPGNESDVQTVVHMAECTRAKDTNTCVICMQRVGRSYFRWWIPPDHIWVPWC